MTFKTIRWSDKEILILDQRLLPGKERYISCKTVGDVARAIETMAIRGAPAIGVAAALGLALGIRRTVAVKAKDLPERFDALCLRLAKTRPTARNLFWAIERMKKTFYASAGGSRDEILHALTKEALSILREDVASNKALGRHGRKFVKNRARILTYCNAGALATAGYGTALGVIRAAVDQGKKVQVFACETRPLLQGARLTAWELMRDGIPVTLMADNMAGPLMRTGGIDAVIVGADRIARNGDTANKIGTYTLAVLASENSIPFYVAAPFSTIDLSLRTGRDIPIEERPPREVTHIAGRSIAPTGIAVRNPAFDVTSHSYISAIITDRGIAAPPYGRSLKKLVETAGR